MRNVIMAILLVALGVMALLTGCGGGGERSTASGGTITGSMLTAYGTAMTRADGAVTIGIEGTSLATRPDDTGAFTLANVPPGAHTLCAMTGDGRSARLMVAVVERARETHVGGLTLEGAGWIAGMVTSAETGHPIGGARVTVIEVAEANTAAEMPHPVRVAYTLSDGSYLVRGLPAGSYVASIEKRGFKPASLRLHVIAGQTTVGDAALQTMPPATGAMHGTVYMVTRAGLAPLPGALVRLVPATFPDPDYPMPAGASNLEMLSLPEYFTFSREDGTYDLTDVPAGDYLAVAVRSGFDPHRQKVAIVANASVQVDFKLQLHLPEIGVITGKVTDRASGQPIAGAVVRALVIAVAETDRGSDAGFREGALIGPTGTNCQMFAVTDERGVYRLLVPRWVNAVSAGARGFLPLVQPVIVIPGGSVTVDFALAPLANERYTLSGVVRTTLASGETVPVADATVYLSPTADGPVILDSAMPAMIFTAKTDAQGYYEILLPAGKYLAFAVKDTWRSEKTTFLLDADLTRDFLLLPPVVASG